MRTRAHVGAPALASLVAVMSASPAFAQVALNENHYKVYQSTPIAIVRDVKLTDQFGAFNVTDLVFDRFSTPAEKIHPDGTLYPIVDPLRHLDWWRVFSPQPSRTIVGKDQFGQAPWTVGNAVYLLTPSLKNPQPPDSTLQLSNHYVCYEALAGPLVGIPVTLVDQFGNVQVTVLHAKYFCNPAQKEVDGGFGGIWPIEDPVVHLACYAVDNPQSDLWSITAKDQFGFWSTQIYHNDCLCVPALKDHALPTKESTWGRIKALYRN